MIMRKLHLLKSLFLLCALIVGSSSVWGETVTLSNANIVAAGDGVSGYNTYNMTDEGGNSWSAYAIKNKHSNATASYHYLQIRAYNNGTAYYIQVPTLGSKITSITMTVSGASQPMTGGSNSATLFFSNSKSTSSTGTGVASGTGTSSVTIDCSSLDLNSGYITAGGAVRIWDVTVTYSSSDKSDCDLALTGAPVALSFDLYNNASSKTINYTTSSTGAVTIAESDYAEFDIDEDNKTITVTPTAVTPSAQTITINQADDDNYNAGSATFTISIDDSTPIPTHTVTFSVNGTTTTQVLEEGAAITFPADPANISDKTFVGWTTTAIDGTTNDAPTFVTSATMGQSDITYYAVFANVSGSSPADVIKSYGFETESDPDWTIDGPVRTQGESNTGSYAGKISTNNSYVTFNSKVKVKEFSFAFKRTSTNNNYNVYIETSEDNSNWTAAETYAMGSFNNGSYLTKTKEFDGTKELYVRFHCSNTTAVRYVDDVTIKYVAGGFSYSDYCTTVVADTRQDAELSFSVTEVNANISEQFTAPTLNTAEGFNGTVEYTSSDENVAQVMVLETGELRLLKEGTTTITATFAGNDDFKPGSASYTLNVTDNRIATTISQEDIVLDVSEVATFTRLAPVVKDANNNIVEYQYDVFPTDVSFEYDTESDVSGVISSLDWNTGEITLSGNVGTVTMKAYYNPYNSNSSYKPSECTFTITVESVQTISEVRTQGSGEVLTKGIVTSCSGTTAYIQDATAAICVYGSALTVGDKVKVSGTLKDYNGLLEITNPTVTVISQNNTVTPEVMTIAEINASDKQGWLVKIEEATVKTINDKNVTIAQGENTIVVRFNNTNDITIKVGDVVTLTGNIGCFNVAQIANPTNVQVKAIPTITIDPAVLNVNADEHDGTLDLTYANLTISDMTDFDIQYYDAEGEETTEPDWIEVLVAEQDPSDGDGYVVSYYMIENEGEARTAYFKVYATDDETNLVYSNLVTVNQAKYVPDYATLPFEWDDTTTPTGITNNGVGTYNGSPYLKFDSSDDEIILKINEAPGVLTFDIKGNPSSGQWSGLFMVKASADGIEYKDVAHYTDLTSTVENMTVDNLASDVRYIKWTYTKTYGNVALGNIKLTAKAGTITLANACTDGEKYYGTYSSSKAFIAPAGVTVSEIGIVDGKLNVKNYSEGDVIPANTGVMVSSAVAGLHNLYATEETGESVLGDNNCLRASGNSGITADAMAAADANCLFYRLTMHNGETIGFWWGAENGAAFALAANKAYMAVPEAQAARGFSFADDMTTSISATLMNNETMNNEYYNLNGQRVANPTKGLYIVNGKKMVVK